MSVYYVESQRSILDSTKLIIMKTLQNKRHGINTLQQKVKT